jgi:drug/metabolite transporter (DMT)-like permease
MLFYVLGILVAIQLVIGQGLWKIATEKSGFTLSPHYLFSHQILKFIFSPYTLAGMTIYILATLLYMGMLAKYQYSAVQGLVVPLSLITAFAVAKFFFHDRLSVINILGLLVLIVGILLATKR